MPPKTFRTLLRKIYDNIAFAETIIFSVNLLCVFCDEVG